MDIAVAVAVGLAAGVVAGLFGVGGGILFVPTLVLALGLTQLHAEATSLLAIIPTVAAGTWRNVHYGTVHARTALVIGLASVLGVQIGVLVAHSLSEVTLKRLFAAFMLVTAAQIAWRARKSERTSK
jgi:uncharacterized membrane protein YfcA